METMNFKRILLFIWACMAFLVTAAKEPPLHRFIIPDITSFRKFIKYTSDQIPLVSSHRGGGEEAGFPENCLETFQHTLENTWSLIECDPRYTKDSVMVLMHDETVDRTTNGKGKVSDYTLAEIKKLFLKDNFGNITSYKIPTLDEALDWAKGKTVLILDKKKTTAAERARAILNKKANLAAVVMCYTPEDAAECYNVSSDVLMQSITTTNKQLTAYEKTGVPWQNVFAFVSQTKPQDDDLIENLHKRGVMAIIGCSFTSDRLFLNNTINKTELYNQYYQLLAIKADIIETNLGIFVGDAINKKYPIKGSKKSYFKIF